MTRTDAEKAPTLGGYMENIFWQEYPENEIESNGPCLRHGRMDCDVCFAEGLGLHTEADSFAICDPSLHQTVTCPHCESNDVELCREAYSPETPGKNTPEYIHCYACGHDNVVTAKE